MALADEGHAKQALVKEISGVNQREKRRGMV
jgi:hypothetical protein